MSMAYQSAGEPHEDIDWNALWEHEMALAARKWDDDHFWYERTQLPPIGVKTSTYADELIKCMELSPHHSVLDIGCGDGAIAIRVAKRVKQVTALDVSPNLLFLITRRASLEGITNLKFANAEWLVTRIGRDVPVHDIVLASRFRQIMNLRKFLEQMHLAASERCYLTWIAEREEKDAKICAILGREYHLLPEYFLIINMLESMGISACVDLFETMETHRFESDQEAIDDAIRGYIVADTEIRHRIAQLATSGLEYRGGYVWKKAPVKWALIWWTK